MSEPAAVITRYEIGVIAVSSVGTQRYHIGTFGAASMGDAMEVLLAIMKIPRPVAISMGGWSWWLHDGDLLFVAPMKNPDP